MGFLDKKFRQIVDKADISLSKSKLSNTSWLKTNTGNSRISYSFLNNRELIISVDGDGTRAKWDFIVDNDTLIIEDKKIEVFNFQIIHDEFLILNKDNTDQIEIFGNISKFKNNQEKVIESKFNYLFQRLYDHDIIEPKEKLLILKIYEIMTLLESGSGKPRLKKLFNEAVYDFQSGEKFEIVYKKVANKTIVQSLNQSKFKRDELINLAESLIRFKIVRP